MTKMWQSTVKFFCVAINPFKVWSSTNLGSGSSTPLLCKELNNVTSRTTRVVKREDGTHVVIRGRGSQRDGDRWRSGDGDGPVLAEHRHGDHVAGYGLWCLDVKHLAGLRQHDGPS